MRHGAIPVFTEEVGDCIEIVLEFSEVEKQRNYPNVCTFLQNHLLCPAAHNSTTLGPIQIRLPLIYHTNSSDIRRTRSTVVACFFWRADNYHRLNGTSCDPRCRVAWLVLVHFLKVQQCDPGKIYWLRRDETKERRRWIRNITRYGRDGDWRHFFFNQRKIGWQLFPTEDWCRL